MSKSIGHFQISVVLYISTSRGCSSMVELQPSKLTTWVRFPSPAPDKKGHPYGCPFCIRCNAGNRTREGTGRERSFRGKLRRPGDRSEQQRTRSKTAKLSVDSHHPLQIRKDILMGVLFVLDVTLGIEPERGPGGKEASGL